MDEKKKKNGLFVFVMPDKDKDQARKVWVSEPGCRLSEGSVQLNELWYAADSF